MFIYEMYVSLYYTYVPSPGIPSRGYRGCYSFGIRAIGLGDSRFESRLSLAYVLANAVVPTLFYRFERCLRLVKLSMIRLKVVIR